VTLGINTTSQVTGWERYGSHYMTRSNSSLFCHLSPWGIIVTTSNGPFNNVQVVDE